MRTPIRKEYIGLTELLRPCADARGRVSTSMQSILAAQMGYGMEYITEACRAYEAEHGRPDGMGPGEPEASFHEEPKWEAVGPVFISLLRRIVSGDASPELLEQIRDTVAEFDGEEGA